MGATVQRTAMLQRKKGTYIEDDTTDAGSSDADSSCSSGSEGGLQSGRSFNDWAAASRLRRLAPRKLTMGRKSRFSSTPLATIPGTPNAEQHMELSAAPIEQPEQNNDRKCAGYFGHSTTKCARRSLLLNRKITSEC